MIILRQKEYARRDYEGLTEAQAKVMKQQRSQLARDIVRARQDQAYTANRERAALATSGRSQYTGKYIDLSGKEHTTATMGFDKPLDFNKVKELQRGDRQIQNAELLREAGLRKDEINKKVKKMERPKNINSNAKASNPIKPGQEGFIKRSWNKLGTGGKIAAVAVPTVAAIGTGIAVRNKNKKED